MSESAGVSAPLLEDSRGAQPTPHGDGFALRARDIRKHFGATKALRGASLDVRAGTIHALVGGNGSGKSTMIKILAGVYRADGGTIEVFGVQTEDEVTPASASAAGLRFVHQDLGLFDGLSIEENFALDSGYPLRVGQGIRWKALRRAVQATLEEFEIDASPQEQVARLRPTDRTMVAVARALQGADRGRRVLVLDEPTATLAEAESLHLLQRLRALASRGQTIVMVSHRLREILSIADDFTVFRDGKVAATVVGSAPSEDELIALMAGRATSALVRRPSSRRTDTEPALALRDVHGGPLRGVSLTVAAGEIVGLAGLVGSGRSSTLETVFGAHRPSGGTMERAGRRYAPGDVAEAMRAGVALVPENRIREAAFMDRTVSENLAIVQYRAYWKSRWMPRRREIDAARRLISSLGVRVAGPDALFSSMSGGNQQKVVLGRWLQRKPEVLLLDEPTQGVDVMSRADIYEQIRAAAADGCAVIVASSDMTELHILCDRIVLLHRGRSVGEYNAADIGIDEMTALVLRDGGTGDRRPGTPDHDSKEARS